ncbi:L,D-transpeptidase family protein [Candidatus Azambacteria bacterium]|nr:L,D-transpeptidase family protein [Candidatus Azambacteria bacterium]
MLVSADGRLLWKDREYRCALGKNGVTAHKKEGDGATPVGCFPVRKILYRSDRMEKPTTDILLEPIAPTDGWCDDSNDDNYNRLVMLPYHASHERLWREDNLYDLIVVLGYNDEPPIPGKGSAIFMHVARPNYTPTAGCIALALSDLLEIIKTINQSTRVCMYE